MKIKELKKILNQAPDENRNVYIPHTIVMPTSGSVHHDSSTSVGHNFDDNNDLDLYVISEEEKSACCNARMIDGVQCETCGADGRRICKICGDELDILDDLVCGYHSME